MASICRSGAVAAKLAAGGGTRSALSLHSVFQLGSSSSRTFSSSFSSSLLRRSVMVTSALIGTVEMSLMPLHSAEASTRLNSLIAANSTSWIWLTHGRALPL